MRIMKQILCFVIAFLGVSLGAESLTLESAITKAKAHYPLHKNKDLLQKAQNLELTKLNISYAPRIKLNAKATYQSDVTALPFSSQTLNNLAGGNINYKPLNKDQYNANIEIAQPLFDAGNLWANRSTTKAHYALSQAQLESTLYAVQSSVINAYFSALLLKRQVEQSAVHIQNLSNNQKTLQARYANGVANKSDVDKIHIEILTSQKHYESLKNEHEIALSTLKELVGLEEAQEVELVSTTAPNLPDLDRRLHSSALSASVFDAHLFESRPEMRVFSALNTQITTSKNAQIARSLPYIDAFFQFGYGNPALNILKSGFNDYYIAGVRLNWDFGNLYSTHQQSELRRVQILQNDAQKEEFLLNAKITLKSQIAHAQNLSQTLKANEQIIALQEELVKSAQTRLKNGVLSVNDFLTEINGLNALKLQNHYDEIALLKQLYEIRQTVNAWEENE